MSLPSKHGWGPPGRTRNIYRKGVVRELEVSGALGDVGRRGIHEDKTTDKGYEVPWTDMDRLNIYS